MQICISVFDIFDLYFVLLSLLFEFHADFVTLLKFLFFLVFPVRFRFHIWHASIWLIHSKTHKHTHTPSKWLKLIFIAPIYIYHSGHKKTLRESVEW